MDSHDIDPRKRHHLSAEFSSLLTTLGDLLQRCANVDKLRKFLQLYSHPLYPETLYIEPNVYCNAEIVT